MNNNLHSIHADGYPPPSFVHISDLNRSHLIFSWRAPVRNCPSLSYKILATNCGDCPSSTNTTNTSCMIGTVTEIECIFTLKTIVCGNILSNESYSLKVSFRGKLACIKYVR